MGRSAAGLVSGGFSFIMTVAGATLLIILPAVPFFTQGLAMQDTFVFRSIGVIRSPFTSLEDTPIQSARSGAGGRVEVFEPFIEGLKDIEGFSHLILLYVFHRAGRPQMVVRPFLDDEPRGVFATRHPARPNPIGLSIVELVSRQRHVLHVRGIDVLDGTPLLDLKPYVPKFDYRAVTRTGWLSGQEEERPWGARYDE